MEVLICGIGDESVRRWVSLRGYRPGAASRAPTRRKSQLAACKTLAKAKQTAAAPQDAKESAEDAAGEAGWRLHCQKSGDAAYANQRFERYPPNATNRCSVSRRRDSSAPRGSGPRGGRSRRRSAALKSAGDSATAVCLVARRATATGRAASGHGPAAAVGGAAEAASRARRRAAAKAMRSGSSAGAAARRSPEAAARASAPRAGAGP